MEEVAERLHHARRLVWRNGAAGGDEDTDGPVDGAHALVDMLGRGVEREDPRPGECERHAALGQVRLPDSTPSDAVT